MGLLDKQSLKIPGVKDFCWSPAQNIISYFVTENGNTPAKVVLVNIPSRKEVRPRSLVSVTDCKMHWQPDGKYLSVKVDRQKKKSTFVNFELFRVKEKDVPIEALELKENVHAFAWEPHGDRFAVIHGENANRPDVSFYSLAGRQLQKLKTLEKRAANTLFWSPAGGFIVLAGLRALSGVLEFFDVNNLETIANEEHPTCTNVEWDPSGQFVATHVSYWRHQLDTGYNIYSFTGKLLYKVLKDKFFQLLWRPQPPSLLSEEQRKTIQVELSKYSKRYNIEDRAAKQKKVAIERAKREATKKEFYELVKEREKEYIAWRAELKKVLGRDIEAEEQNLEQVEEKHEELEEYTEEILADQP